MVSSKQWRKAKFTGFLFLAVTVSLLVALIAGCAPAATTTPAKPAPPPAPPIVIGFTNSLNTVAKDLYNAAAMAVDEINAKDGGILIDGVKRPLKIVGADTRDLEPGVPAGDSILAVKDLISREKPAGIVHGIIRSEVQLAIQQNMATEKIPQIYTGGVNATWSANFKKDPEKFKYQFKISPTNIDLVVLLMGGMGFLKQKFGYSTTAIFAEDVDFARAGAEAVKPMLEKAGWTVKDMVYIPLGTTDYSAPMTKFKDSGADVGFLLMSSEGAALPKQYQAMGLKNIFIGSCSPLYEEKTYAATNGACEGFCIAVNGAGNAPWPKVAAAQAFYDAFVKKYAYSPRSSLGVSQSYDAVYMLANAWKANGSLDPDKAIATIQSTPFAGAGGLATFAADNHQCAYGNDPTKTFSQNIFQWQNGKRVTVYPPALADAEIQINK